MKGARWTASISERCIALTTFSLLVISNCQIAGDQKNLFPIFVDERLCSVDPRIEAKKARTRSSLIFFIQSSRQNFLLDAGGIARWHFPATGHIECVEFIV